MEVKFDFNVKEGDAGSNRQSIEKLGRLQLYNGNLAVIYGLAGKS